MSRHVFIYWGFNLVERLVYTLASDKAYNLRNNCKSWCHNQKVNNYWITLVSQPANSANTNYIHVRKIQIYSVASRIQGVDGSKFSVEVHSKWIFPVLQRFLYVKHYILVILTMKFYIWVVFLHFNLKIDK